jgi:hypothetical protein
MIAQKTLVQILNAESEISKINADIAELCKPMNDRLATLQANLDAKKKEVLTALLNSEEIEQGKRFAELKTSQPRASVAWKDEWTKEIDKLGRDSKSEAEKLAEESKKGKSPTHSLIVK